jgi:hypothetical protein
MKIDGDRLRIDYTVHNRTNDRIVLVDRLRDNSRPTDLAIVRESDRPSTVAFTLAYVPQDRRVHTRERRPFARILEARSSTTGTAYARWPLRSHHNFSTPLEELPPGMQTAMLEIGYVDGATVIERDKLEGELHDVPDWRAVHFQKIIRSNILRLPSP